MQQTHELNYRDPTCSHASRNKKEKRTVQAQRSTVWSYYDSLAHICSPRVFACVCSVIVYVLTCVFTLCSVWTTPLVKWSRVSMCSQRVAQPCQCISGALSGGQVHNSVVCVCVLMCVCVTVCVVLVRFDSGSLGGHSSACHLLNVMATHTSMHTVSAKTVKL